MDIEKIISTIQNEKLFLIVSHVSPDGDNVGSSCALVQYLKNMGKEAYYLMDEELPRNLKFIWEKIDKIESDYAKKIVNLKNYTVIALDSGDCSRIQADKEIIKNASFFINIDHHITNDNYGDLNYVQRGASSTCEVVLDILEKIDQTYIDKYVATSLYTGIVTDTGNFQYDSANSDTLRKAADLMEKGADRDKIIEAVYRSNPYNIIVLTGKVLNTLEIFDDISILSLNYKTFEETGTQYSDAETLVNYAIDIEKINVGCMLKEKNPGEIRVSLRSKSKEYNVSKVAQSLGGGGHIMAAGCTVYGTIEQAKEKVLTAIKEICKNV